MVEQYIKLPVSEYQTRLCKHYVIIKENLEYEYGLMDSLRSFQVFSEEEFSSLTSATQTRTKTVEMLLETLKQRRDSKKYEMFMKALQDNLQSHLKQLFLKNGNFDKEDSDRPLKSCHRKYVQTNWQALIYCMKSGIKELVDVLIEWGCLNDCHRDAIRSILSEYDKARLLLEIISRRSISHLMIFIKELKKMNESAQCLPNVNDFLDMNECNEENDVVDGKIEGTLASSEENYRRGIDQCVATHAKIPVYSRNMATQINESDDFSSKLTRFQGCLVGALIGDCLGSRFEFCEKIFPYDLLKHVKIFDLNEYKEPRDRKLKKYSDDTAMLRSIAKSLIKNKTFNAKDLAERFVREFYENPNRGYNYNILNVFMNLRNQKYSDPFGPASKQFGGTGSYGNGGAMRIAPVPLFYYNKTDEELKKLTTDVTRITHTHPNGINGALMESYSIRLALKREPSPSMTIETWREFTSLFLKELEEFIRKAETVVSPEDSEENGGTNSPSHGPYTEKIKTMRRLLFEDSSLTEQDVNIAEVVDELGHNVSALHSVPTAVYCFLRSLVPIKNISQEMNPFRRCIILSVLMGGDTDTIASMAGAISGAYHGLESIPSSWVITCEAHKEALEMGQGLHDLITEPSSSQL